jgi:hypothetical protein
MTWTPAILQALMSVAVLVGVGLAVLGQVRWRATQEWEALADARQQRIVSLERDLEFLHKQFSDLQGTLIEQQKLSATQIADVQKLNLDLQRQLQKALVAQATQIANGEAKNAR